MIRHKIAAGLLACLAMTASQASLANLSVAGGITSESKAAARIELDRMIHWERLPSRLGLRLGGGLLLLEGQEERHNAALLVTPALRWRFGEARRLFVEGGIGAALFLHTRHEATELGSAFQFQDRLALGAELGPGELALSVTHYSNGGIKSPNNGFEVLALGYRWAL